MAWPLLWFLSIRSRFPLDWEAIEMSVESQTAFEIGRELRRNALPSGRYSPLHADGAYQLRRRREAILERDPNLGHFVRDRLAEGWTPEQISGWLKAGNEPRLRALGCETIYAFIYRV